MYFAFVRIQYFIPNALGHKLYHFSFSDEPQKKASAPTYPTPSTTWTGEVRGQPAPRPNLDPSSSASPKSAMKKTKNELQVEDENVQFIICLFGKRCSIFIAILATYCREC